MERSKPTSLLWGGLIGVLLASNLFATEIKGIHFEPNPEDRAGGYGGIKSYRQMQFLKELGANTLVFSPSAYQKDAERPELIFDAKLGEGLEKDIAIAKKLGFRIVVAPAIDPISTGEEFPVRRPIAMRSQEEWRRWFFNYERMIVHFGALAQRSDADVFVIGTEYDRATRDRDAEWRRIIKSVRAVFTGRLTYAARGFEEAQRIRFWSDLDVIGINSDFRLSGGNTPTPDELKHAWDGVIGELSLLSKRNGEIPVLITELGYYSVDGVAQRPSAPLNSTATPDLDEQAHCFDAALTAIEKAPWISGVLVSKFKISINDRLKRHAPLEMWATFQDKPAEAVIRSHFSKSSQP